MNTSSHNLDLGAQVCSARRLSGAKSTKAQGFRISWLLYYVLVPLIFIPLLAMYAAELPIFLIRGSLKGIPREMLLGLLAFFYAPIFWYVYIFPRGDYCILYEKGIRIRLGRKCRQFAFNSIQSFFVGRAPSKSEQRLRKINRIFNPGIANWTQQLDGTALTIITNDGIPHVFKVFLTRFDLTDLENLFREWIRLNPHLAENDGMHN